MERNNCEKRMSVSEPNWLNPKEINIYDKKTPLICADKNILVTKLHTF